METIAWISSKFCTPVKISKYGSWVVKKRGTQIQDDGLPNIWRLAHFRFRYAHLNHAHILVMSILVKDGQNRYFP